MTQLPPFRPTTSKVTAEARIVADIDSETVAESYSTGTDKPRSFMPI